MIIRFQKQYSHKYLTDLFIVMVDKGLQKFCNAFRLPLSTSNMRGIKWRLHKYWINLHSFGALALRGALSRQFYPGSSDCTLRLLDKDNTVH